MANTKERIVKTETAVTEYPPIISWLEDKRKSGEIILFDNAKPIKGDPLKANTNVIEAVEWYIDNQLDKVDPIVFTGSMGCGKTTLIAKIYQTLEQLGQKVVVYQHALDEERAGDTKNFFIQAGDKGMIVEGIKPTLYKKVDDLLDPETGIKWSEVDTVIIDEFMFSNKMEEVEDSLEEIEDPPKEIEEKVEELFQKAKEHNVKIIIALIHSDFRGVMWPNFEILTQHINQYIELHGRCDTKNCNNPSELTSRLTAIEDENKEIKYIPSLSNERICRPGSVLNGIEVGDKYKRSCLHCHKFTKV